ncbi:hypothetical protein [Actomonas aquatica]|uniref:Ig-like domain-containing protein n=1 Tax=Actomonas aquatica TaxID=2866162 RepID=A0ABZ1C3A5_9BACT|nr:hypothetical protein [Opitutus sp. WL0086]WRQ86174.1 hypothetical protein K1X11_015270 [Opitutus sp. WL0086]
MVAGVMLGAAVAGATDNWAPEGWFNSPLFTQNVIADRVTEGPDGKLYASFYNGGAIDGVRDRGQYGAIIRLHGDGSLDDSFNMGPLLTDAWAIAFQSDGRLVVGGISGDETYQTGLPQYRVYRLNYDGSWDYSFQSPVFRGIPRFIAVDPVDDSLIVVPSSGDSGNGGIPTLARLNADGSLDGNWNEPDLAGGFIFAPPVIDGNGKILIGGVFDNVNGATRHGVARLNANGTLDSSFVPSGYNPDWAPHQIRGLAVQTQGNNAGKVIVAGGTILVPGSDDAAANRPLIRLNSNGSLDTTFSLTTQGDAGMYARPRLVEVLPDDSIVIVGGGVARFSADGVQFPAPVNDPGESGTYSRPTFSTEFFWMEALSDGSVIVPPQQGAWINGEYAPTFVKFDPTGVVDGNFNAPQFTRTVYPSGVHGYGEGDGRFLVWGNFDTVNGEPRPGIVRFFNNGSIDYSFSTDFAYPPSYVSSAHVADDGDILVTIFDPFGGGSQITRLTDSGSVDTGFAIDESLAGQLGDVSLNPLSDGSILLVGVNAQRLYDGNLLIAKLTDTGAIDTNFNGAALLDVGAVFRDGDDVIQAMTLGYLNFMAEDANGRLIFSKSVGPYVENQTSMDITLVRTSSTGVVEAPQTFSAPTINWLTNGVTFPSIYQTTTENYRQVATTYVGSPFQKVVAQPDNKIIVGGLFEEIAGEARSGIARLNADGSFDYGFNTGSGVAFDAAPNRLAQITDIMVAGNERIWLTGYFDSFSGEPAPGVVQLESDGSRVANFNAFIEMLPYTGSDMTITPTEGGWAMLLGGTYRTQNEWYPVAFHRMLQLPLVNIYAQPQNISIPYGYSGALRVGYDNPQAEVSIQWYRNDEPIQGANDAELNLFGQNDTAGYYYAVFTAPNGETQQTNMVEVRLSGAGAFWRRDYGFNAPQLTSDRLAGRVTSDGNGGYYGTWVNGNYLSGADGVVTGPVVHINADGTVDGSFNTGAALNDAWAVQPLPDGGVLVGGVASEESGISGQALPRVFKFDAFGNLDPNYQSPVLGGLPRFMTLQPDGKLIVVPTGNNGSNGGPQWIARLNTDGSLDESFHQVWLNGVIFAPPVVDPVSGKIYIGGSFWTVDNQYRPAVARLNADGSLDTEWYPSGINPNDNAPYQVRGLALQTQGDNAGKLLVAGNPLYVPDGNEGTFDAAVVRLNLNGSLDTSFTHVSQGDAGMSPRARLLHLHANDDFSIVGQSVTRFDADGALHSTFQAPSFSGEAYWFAVDTNGKIVVPTEWGTLLETAENTPDVSGWVRFNSDGTWDTDFHVARFELATFPNRFAIMEDDGILTWGGFSKAGDTYWPGIVRIDSDGRVDTNFNPSSLQWPVGVVFAEVTPGNQILATTTDQVTGERGLVRLDSDGTLDETFAVDSEIGSMTGVETKVLSSGKILAWAADAQRVIDDETGFTRLLSTGAIDDTFTGTPTLPALGAVYRNEDGSIRNLSIGNFRILTVDADGNFYARTTIDGYGEWTGGMLHTIQRFSAEGVLDTNYNAPGIWWGTFESYPTVTDAQTNGGVADQVRADVAYTPFNGAVALDDGSVIVFGRFTWYGDQYSPGIVRLTNTGAVDSDFSARVGSGASFLAAPNRNGNITAVTPAGNGQFWVAGFFDSFNGHALPGIALLNNDGSLDTSFATDIEFQAYFATAMGVGVDSQDRLVLAGSYQTYAGVNIQPFQRLVKTIGFVNGELPYNITYAGNETIELDASVAGMVNPVFVWRKDGIILPGETGPILTLENAGPDDAGFYAVEVEDDNGRFAGSTSTLMMAGAFAGSGPIYGIGDLPGGAFYSQVRDATLVDGVIHAVGTSVRRGNEGSAGDTGVYWRSDSGLYLLPEIEPDSQGFGFVTASAITPTASHIANRTRVALDNTRAASRVTVDGFGVERLPDPTNFGSYSAATTISADGNQLGGFYWVDTGGYHAFLTDLSTDPVSVTEIVPTLPDYEWAFVAGGRGMSADGTVVVGDLEDIESEYNTLRGYRYDVGAGMTVLPTLETGFWASAMAVSADGVHTLLRGDSSDFPAGELFVHNSSDGSVTTLGAPRPDVYPLNIAGTTDDFSVIVCSFYDVDTHEGGTYIHNYNGWFSLQEALAGMDAGLDGWSFDDGLGVSRDGRLIYGSGSRYGQQQGFVIEFPAGYLADFEPAPMLDGPSDDIIVGAWVAGTSDHTFTVIFDRDGSYVHIGLGINLGEANGYERGHYGWDKESGLFTVTTVADFNGDQGLDGINFRSDLTLSVSGDQLTLTIPNDEVVTLNRVTHPTHTMVGAWSLNDFSEQENGGAYVVLLADGTYFHAEEGEQDADGQSGIEHGSWTWEDMTSRFTAFDIDADTNGQWGLSHPQGVTYAGVWDYRWTLLYSDDGGSASLRRVAPQPVDIEAHPMGGDYTEGDEITLSVGVVGEGPFTYQWRHEGQEIPGATGSTLVLSGLGFEDAGYYDVAVTGPDGLSLSDGAWINVFEAPPPGRVLLNYSARIELDQWETASVPFRIEGSGDKELLIRVVGPALGALGIPNVMADPSLLVVDELGFDVTGNDDWDSTGGVLAAAASSVGALSLADGSADAAVIALLPPGSYTLQVAGADAGQVIAELYDLDGSASTSRLVYIGALAPSTTGGQLNIGFTTADVGSAELLVRAIGPSLGLAGAISDPSLTVLAGGTTLASNDNWGGTTELMTAFSDAVAPMLDPSSADAAVVTDFNGNSVYSLTMNGNESGLTLTEVYDTYRREPIVSPVLLHAPQSLTVSGGFTARFEPVVASSSTVAYQWFKNGAELTGATSRMLEIADVQSDDAGTYVLRLTNANGTVDSAPATLTVLSGPDITSQPSGTTISSGTTATLAVTATSEAGDATYQWYAGTSGDTTAPISGATAATYTTPALDASADYWVRVTDSFGSVDSVTATVVVETASDIYATHAVVGAGYRAGGTVTIETTFYYTGAAVTVGWSVDLPAGWSFASTNDPGFAWVPPEEGDTGNISFAFTRVPVSPVTFSYTLNVPAGQTGSVELTSTVLFRDGVNPEQPFTVTPSPLVITEAPAYHSGDSDQDGFFSLSELLRVIELYNTRNGTTRTGHYKVQSGTEDGFASNPDLADSESGNLTVFHSGDSDQDGKISLSELLRVIELYNYRQGTTRTGQYHPATGTEDGYAPGPEPTS